MQNTHMLRNLRAFNIIVLILFLVFQVPIFECPALETDKTVVDTFITNKRC